jgi:hypothetical protein
MADIEKCNISYPPIPSSGFSDILFSTLNVLQSMIPKDQKNMTTLK